MGLFALEAGAEVRKVVADSPAFGDNFGHSVAADEGIAVVGLFGDDDPLDSGSVKIFEAGPSGSWTERGTFKAFDAGNGGNFGYHVAYRDGNAFIGALGDNFSRGAVYWMTRQPLVPFSWVQPQKITAPDSEPADFFGRSIDTQGDRLVISSVRKRLPDTKLLCGAVFVYQKVDEVWELQQTLRSLADCVGPGDDFGASVSLDGDRLAVGTLNGRVQIFELQSGVWQETARIEPAPDANDDYTAFGREVKLEGNRLLVSSPSFDEEMPGNRAYVYEYAAGSWTRAAELIVEETPPLTGLGFAIALQGDLALVSYPTGPEHGGSFDPGAVYLFERQSGGAWQQARRYLGPSGPGTYFGSSLDFDGDQAWVGAHTDNDGITWGTGAAYVIDIAPQIFADGFESGNLAGWSSVLP